MVTAVTVTVFAKYSGRPFLLYEMRDAMLSLFNWCPFACSNMAFYHAKGHQWDCERASLVKSMLRTCWYKSTIIMSNNMAVKFYGSTKKRAKIWQKSKKSVPLHPLLSYGVMVAQQVLVLFVVVRIRLGQQLKPRWNHFPRGFFMILNHFFCYYFCITICVGI